MSNLPISSKYVSRPNDSVTDADRNDITEQLNEAFAEGKIEAYDYQDLLEKIYNAETLGELQPVVAKLPVRATFDEPEIVKQNTTRPPGEVSTINPGVMAMSTKLAAGFAVLGLILVVVLIIMLL